MKKWKIALITLFVLIAGGAGTLYYFLEVKDYGTEDEKLDEIVKSDYEVVLPGDKATADKGKTGKSDDTANNTEGSEDNNATTSESQAGTDQLAASIVAKTKPASKQNTSTTPSGSGSDSTPAETDKVTADSIINKYMPSFENLQAQADGKLASLISYAIGEYQSKKAAGEEVSYFYFYSKYTGAAASLEASTDASFNQIYGALTAELEANGFDASAAKGIKADYNATKKAQRNALMNEAMSRLK